MSRILHTPEISKERILSIKRECNFHSALGHYFCYVDENEHQIDWLPMPWQSLMVPKVLGTCPSSGGSRKKRKVTAFSSPHSWSPISGQVVGLMYLFPLHVFPLFLIRDFEDIICFEWADPMEHRKVFIHQNRSNAKYDGEYQGRRIWLVGLKKLTYLKIPANNAHLYNIQMSENMELAT